MTTPSLGTLPVNVDALLTTRLLVQANSGGGKSYCLRRLLEQTAGSVQQLVIDLEGEFATLRERFDTIICAPHDGDAVANPDTAAALARALWESGASAILDIYDLKAHERTLFVKRFCEALIAAPKHVWHPTLVVIDECHLFAPQNGQAESSSAVIDLATRGRKRGLALVAATQRLSKLHKDVAAEMLNKLIGRTGLDIDVTRAADELGLPRKEAFDVLRTLAPGEFFAFGPALSPTVVRTRIGPVKTSHPSGSQRAMVAPPAPSPALRAKLAKLEGIQREAADELATVESLQHEVAQLRRQLAKAPVQQPPAPSPQVLQVELARAEATGRAAAHAELRARIEEPVASLIQQAMALKDVLAKPVAKAPVRKAPVPAPAPAARPVAVKPTAPAAGSEAANAPQQRVLNALGWWSAAGTEEPTRHQVAFVAGYTVNGHFNNQVGALRREGLIEYPGLNCIRLTPAGKRLAQRPQDEPSKDELIGRIRAVLKGEPMRRIFDVLVEADGAALTREECARRAGYTVNGHFNNQVGALNSLRVAEYPGKGTIALGKLVRDVPTLQ